MTVEKDHDTDLLDGLFGDDEADMAAKVGYSAEHAAPANYGTSAHWPPLTPLLGWTTRMGWDNPGLHPSMSEGEMWDEVSRRQQSGERLPAAYLLAQHIATHGTNPLMFASDALAHAHQEGERWLEQQGYDADTDLAEILVDFGAWTLEESNTRLRDRVSIATTGELLESGFAPEGDQDVMLTGRQEEDEFLWVTGQR